MTQFIQLEFLIDLVCDLHLLIINLSIVLIILLLNVFFLILVHFFEILYLLLLFWLNRSRCFKRAWRRIFSGSKFPSAFARIVKGAKENKLIDGWLIDFSSIIYVVQLCWWIWYKHIFWITERKLSSLSIFIINCLLTQKKHSKQFFQILIVKGT